MTILRQALAFATLSFGCAVMAAGCFSRNDEHRHAYECDIDEECAFMDDGDPCYAPAYCDVDRYSCERPFLQDDASCQCEHGGDCLALGYENHQCTELTCENRQCGEVTTPAGPAADWHQRRGDCLVVMCDGTNVEGTEEPDLEDVASSDCAVHTCTVDGPEETPLVDGDVCTSNDGICYDGSCFPGCVPSNPAACGGEGTGEPANNIGDNAAQFNDGDEVCGMIDTTDVDWYTMYLEDEDFEADIIGFSFRSSAPTLEVCAYVRCINNGAPLGGCSNKLTGPNLSQGCCWQGPPETLSPTWDLDCADTADDSGDMFFSVRAINGDDCDTYTVSAHY